MNTVDMHTREKVNKIHLDEMHQEAKLRQMLQQASRETDTNDRNEVPSFNMKIFLGKLSALLPHHVPRRHVTHSVK
jgi:hypothetical protein